MIDNLKGQLDQADSRLEFATNRLSSQIDTELDNTELNSQLEARRAKLGLA
jgi:hypothetical protein